MFEILDSDWLCDEVATITTGVNGFCLLILHVTTIRHDQFTSEIYCGTQRRGVYLAGRAGKSFHF